jgi:hypothetical protein
VTFSCPPTVATLGSGGRIRSLLRGPTRASKGGTSTVATPADNYTPSEDICSEMRGRR